MLNGAESKHLTQPILRSLGYARDDKIIGNLYFDTPAVFLFLQSKCVCKDTKKGETKKMRRTHSLVPARF